MRALLGDNAKDEYLIERVEIHNIWACHFVIDGILGRGVSSSTSRLDNLGKGFAGYILDKFVGVPMLWNHFGSDFLLVKYRNLFSGLRDDNS